MSDDKKNAKVEEVIEGFFGRLKEVFAEVLEDVAEVIADKSPTPKAKLAVVKDNGRSEAATEPPPPPPDAPSNVRNLRPAS